MYAFLFEDFDCFDYDLDWYGNNILVQPGVFSPRDCQAFCKSNEACTSFVYNTSGRYCVLRDSMTGTETNKYIVSGPKDCPTYQGIYVQGTAKIIDYY
jgi:hypothetical protein